MKGEWYINQHTRYCEDCEGEHSFAEVETDVIASFNNKKYNAVLQVCTNCGYLLEDTHVDFME